MKKISFNKNIFTVLLVFVFTLLLVACDTGPTDEEVVNEALESLTIGFQSGDNAASVTKKVTLPASVGDVTVTWTTNNAEAIAANGDVTRVYKLDQEVRLTATLKFNDAQDVKNFDLVVKALVDNIPPAFMGAISGKLAQVKHLETATVDLLEGVTARDNVDNYDVEITLDTKDYNKDVAGTYTVTYTATDSSGNETTIDRDIVVEPALDATVDAAVIGDDWVEYVYNDTGAFVNNGTYGAEFRTHDKLYVMDKAFFSAELAEHASEYPGNAKPVTVGIPVFPYGSLIITDKDFNIIHARFQFGVYIELNVVDGETILTHTDVEWNEANTGVAGGHMFVGVESKIPEGGFVMFASSPAPQKTRVFLVSNLFQSNYTGGATTKDGQDIFDLTTITLELKEDYRVLIPLPDKIGTPEITLNRHTLSWTAIPNALNYSLIIDGQVHGNALTSTSIDLSTLDLAISEDDGYEIQVRANTLDIFKYSSSDLSDTILYKKVVIQTLDAPVIEVDTENTKLIKWSAVEGAAEYEVYVQNTNNQPGTAGSYSELVGKTTNTSFDVTEFTKFNGVNYYYVIGIGMATHSDSVRSNRVLIDQTVTTTMNIGGMLTEVIVTNYTDYFNRRNEGSTSPVKLGNNLYLVTGIDQITSWGGLYNESGGAVVILDKDLNVKVVRGIFAKETFTVVDKWFTDESYAANNAQTVGFGDYVGTGDMLLIGRNGYNATYISGETTSTAAARDLVAYHFINPWTTFPQATAGAQGAGNGWRAGVANFIDPTLTEISFVTAE